VTVATLAVVQSHIHIQIPCACHSCNTGSCTVTRPSPPSQKHCSVATLALAVATHTVVLLVVPHSIFLHLLQHSSFSTGSLHSRNDCCNAYLFISVATLSLFPAYPTGISENVADAFPPFSLQHPFLQLRLEFYIRCNALLVASSISESISICYYYSNTIVIIIVILLSNVKPWPATFIIIMLQHTLAVPCSLSPRHLMTFFLLLQHPLAIPCFLSPILIYLSRFNTLFDRRCCNSPTSKSVPIQFLSPILYLSRCNTLLDRRCCNSPNLYPISTFPYM
jgi:hypothetical protein